MRNRGIRKEDNNAEEKSEEGDYFSGSGTKVRPVREKTSLSEMERNKRNIEIAQQMEDIKKR